LLGEVGRVDRQTDMAGMLVDDLLMVGGGAVRIERTFASIHRVNRGSSGRVNTKGAL
jgi:hypothetical protein